MDTLRTPPDLQHERITQRGRRTLNRTKSPLQNLTQRNSQKRNGTKQNIHAMQMKEKEREDETIACHITSHHTITVSYLSYSYIDGAVYPHYYFRLGCLATDRALISWDGYFVTWFGAWEVGGISDR